MPQEREITLYLQSVYVQKGSSLSYGYFCAPSCGHLSFTGAKIKTINETRADWCGFL